ncbi:unnamed protein product, partial [Polarella glacialis]
SSLSKKNNNNNDDNHNNNNNSSSSSSNSNSNNNNTYKNSEILTMEGPPLIPDQAGEAAILQSRPFANGPQIPFVFLRGELEPALTAHLLLDDSVLAVTEASVHDLNPDAIYRGHKARCFHAIEGTRPGEEMVMAGFEHGGLHPHASSRLTAFAAAMRSTNARNLARLADAVLLDPERLFGCVTVQHLVDPQVPRFGSSSTSNNDKKKKKQRKASGSNRRRQSTSSSRMRTSCTSSRRSSSSRSRSGSEITHRSRSSGNGRQTYNLPQDKKDSRAPLETVLDWHVDSDASVVHLALSLGGERTLVYRRCSSNNNSSSNNDNNTSNNNNSNSTNNNNSNSRDNAEEPAEEVQVVLRPGDVYLSSPAFFLHSVRKSDGAEAVAVQLRMAVDVEHTWPRPPARAEHVAGFTAAKMAEAVAALLKQPGWRLPSLK